MKKILIGYLKDYDLYKEIASSIKDNFKNYDVKILDLNKQYNNAIINIKSYKVLNSYLNSFIYKDIIKEDIDSFNPDIIISLDYIFSNLIKDFNYKVISIISEYNPNKLWFMSNSDYYVVNNNLVKDSIKNVDNVKVLGLPINTFKTIKEDIIETKKKYSLNIDYPTYLFFAGGSTGLNYTFNYLKKLASKDYPINIIFLSGKNVELKRRCEDLCYKNNIKNVLVLGYNKQIASIYNMSDVVITKAGTKTINECLMTKKSLILLPSSSKEEEDNFKFIINNHFGTSAKSPISLTSKVKSNLKYPYIVNSMKNRIDNLEYKDGIKELKAFIKEIE